MKINQKFRAFFGLPAEATDAEVDQKLNEAIHAQEHTAQGADAGTADSTEEASTATPEQEPEATQKEEAAAPAITMEAIEVAIKTAVTAATAPLIERLKVVEGQDAEAHTDGEREAVTVTDEETPIWMRNPINQAAARINPKK